MIDDGCVHVRYEPVNCPYSAAGWAGIQYNAGGQQTLLSGSSANNGKNGDGRWWWYALGAYCNHQNGFPASDFCTKQVELHVKVDRRAAAAPTAARYNQLSTLQSIEDFNVITTHPIEQKHKATLHKKADGATYEVVGDTHYLIFYPGFPNGGQSYADIHAPWGTCFKDIPKGGAVVLKVDSSTKKDVQAAAGSSGTTRAAAGPAGGSTLPSGTSIHSHVMTSLRALYHLYTL